MIVNKPKSLASVAKKKDFAKLSHSWRIANSVLGHANPLFKTAWMFNFAKWKRQFIKKHLPFHRCRYLALKDSVYSHEKAITLSPRPVFIVWGMKQPVDLEEFAAEHNIPIYRMEDGFFRSVGLGADHVLPFSLCLDKSGIYFDSSRPSDLENIINEYEFEKNKSLLADAELCLSKIRSLALSKYNEARTDLAPLLYGPKIKKRILVIGQVEDDQSLLYGCERIMTNVELIKAAAAENPEAQIIYKPHPDVLAGKRKEISDPTDVADLAEILGVPLSLKDALHEVDRVYTLTSLAGFEALIHGVPVTTIGAPFYSGWGLTDDRQDTGRRGKSRTLEEIFAAAYLLYPNYRNPESGKKISLHEVISIVEEQLGAIKTVTPYTEMERLQPYNFATRQTVHSRYLYNSTAQSIAIVADNMESLLIAKAMAARGKKVTLMTTRDALANNESLLLSQEEQEKITVVSIHKKYSVPLSAIEARSVALTKAYANNLQLALGEVLQKHIPLDVINALKVGMEDYIYFESLRFYGAKACIEEHDAVLLLINDKDQNVDVIKSFLFHGRQENKLGKIYLALTQSNAREFILELFSDKKADFNEGPDINKAKEAFNDFWWSLQSEKFDDSYCVGESVLVCGNVSNQNYAYSPASLKLLETISRRSSLPTIFFSSALLNATGQNDVKSITLNEDLSNQCSVYNGCFASYKKKYPAEVMEKAEVLQEKLFELFLQPTNNQLPLEFVDIFAPRLRKYVDGLCTQTIFISEVMRLMSNARLFATSMDRSYTSRIIASIARSCQVPSIGIQPQIISTSKRYLPPAVDRMGVIEAGQKEIYSQLGANPQTLFSVGSVNILSRLMRLDECAQTATSPGVPTIFFAMQHSSAFEMLSTARALCEISSARGYRVVVKPHPHQERPVINEIKNIFGASPLIDILSKDSDTYEAISRCSIVVGLFSSVLLEAALWGKDVVVAAFRDLNECIDISRRGLALKALDPETLDRVLTGLVNKGPLAEGLESSRNSYLQENPQFLRPYNFSRLENFIASGLPHPKDVEVLSDYRVSREMMKESHAG